MRSGGSACHDRTDLRDRVFAPALLVCADGSHHLRATYQHAHASVADCSDRLSVVEGLSTDWARFARLGCAVLPRKRGEAMKKRFIHTDEVDSDLVYEDAGSVQARERRALQLRFHTAEAFKTYLTFGSFALITLVSLAAFLIAIFGNL